MYAARVYGVDQNVAPALQAKQAELKRAQVAVSPPSTIAISAARSPDHYDMGLQYGSRTQLTTRSESASDRCLNWKKELRRHPLSPTSPISTPKSVPQSSRSHWLRGQSRKSLLTRTSSKVRAASLNPLKILTETMTTDTNVAPALQAIEEGLKRSQLEVCRGVIATKRVLHTHDFALRTNSSICFSNGLSQGSL